MTTGLILNIMAESGKKLSELLSDLPVYFIKKSNVKCPNELKGKVMERVSSEFEGLPKETVDGIKAFFPNGSAVLIRPSGTEPAIRIYAEAKSEDEVNDLVRKYAALLERVIREVSAV